MIVRTRLGPMRVADPQEDIPVTKCAWCHHWPCTCPRRQVCACGAVIKASEGQLAVVVYHHVRSRQHSSWRARNRD